MSYLSDIIGLIYPVHCCVCGQRILNYQKSICTQCINLLPYTPLNREHPHELHLKFKGKLPIQEVYAPFPFVKEGQIQEIMHLLKYKHKYEIGLRLGGFLGRILCESESYQSIDYIIPIPIHKQKLKKRGYNQSEIIAKGIQQFFPKPILTNVLIRLNSGVSQTQKGRMQRWENVKNLYSIENISQIENKKILLIDDIITTGSTMQICSELLIEKANPTIFLAALAYTVN